MTIECRQLIAEQSRVGVQAVCARAGGHPGRCMTRAELIRDTDFVARVERERDAARAEVERLREAAQAVVDAAPGYTAKRGSVWALDHALDALRDALSRGEADA